VVTGAAATAEGDVEAAGVVEVVAEVEAAVLAQEAAVG
jgi:hypothetical protein